MRGERSTPAHPVTPSTGSYSYFIQVGSTGTKYSVLGTLVQNQKGDCIAVLRVPHLYSEFGVFRTPSSSKYSTYSRALEYEIELQELTQHFEVEGERYAQ